MSNSENHIKTDQRINLTRRGLLVMGAAAVTTWGALPAPALANNAGTRSIGMINLHTNEEFEGVFWANGKHRRVALKRLNEVLRDHRTDDVYPIDPRLLDGLFELHARFGVSEPFHVISGYRSPKTNAALRKSGSGVARKSYHMKGMAIDIRLPGVDTASLRKNAQALQIGGVGYYGKSRFIHLDTGPVRYWNG